MAAAPLPSLLWLAPVLNPGGYSSEALSFAIALDRHYAGSGVPFGLRQFAEQQDTGFASGLPAGMLQLLRRLLRAGAERRAWGAAVCHATPDVWHEDGAFGWGRVQPCPPPGARFHVGRTMYETDRLPEAWVPRINAMHEVWVPSSFAVEQFASSGVDRSRLVVVPEAVDSDFFDPAKHRPLDLGAAAPPEPAGGLFRFLSVFKWEKRKGWDVLLRAYFEEFSAADPVLLLVKTQDFHSRGDLRSELRRFVDGLAAARRPLARYSVLAEDLPLAELPRLYRAADAFVLPSRGEGWGRPHVEAMSMALPVIATNWSGSTEFLSPDCSLPLRVDGLVEVEAGCGPPGHRWAQPSAAHLRELMRWASEHRAEARALGARAREAVLARFSPAAVAREHLLPRLRDIARRLAAREEL